MQLVGLRKVSPQRVLRHSGDALAGDVLEGLQFRAVGTHENGAREFLDDPAALRMRHRRDGGSELAAVGIAEVVGGRDCDEIDIARADRSLHPLVIEDERLDRGAVTIARRDRRHELFDTPRVAGIEIHADQADADAIRGACRHREAQQRGRQQPAKMQEKPLRRSDGPGPRAAGWHHSPGASV